MTAAVVDEKAGEAAMAVVVGLESRVAGKGMEAAVAVAGRRPSAPVRCEPQQSHPRTPIEPQVKCPRPRSQRRQTKIQWL